MGIHLCLFDCNSKDNYLLMLLQGELPIWNPNELEKIEIGAVNECPPEGSDGNCRLSI